MEKERPFECFNESSSSIMHMSGLLLYYEWILLTGVLSCFGWERLDIFFFFNKSLGCYSEVAEKSNPSYCAFVLLIDPFVFLGWLGSVVDNNNIKR